MRISDWSSDVCSSDLQQRAAGAAAGGVDRDHGDAHLREAGEEAVEQFVGDRGLAGAAGAGDADDGGLGTGGWGLGGGLPLLAEHGRSAEHTSELQSLMRISYAVFCLKKTKKRT